MVYVQSRIYIQLGTQILCMLPSFTKMSTTIGCFAGFKSLFSKKSNPAATDVHSEKWRVTITKDLDEPDEEGSELPVHGGAPPAYEDKQHENSTRYSLTGRRY